MAFDTVEINNISDYQEIKIPDAYKIKDNKAYIKKTGGVLYIIPYHNPWQPMIDSLYDFSEDFMESRNQPENQDREPFQ
jgi:antitoxin VapB